MTYCRVFVLQRTAAGQAWQLHLYNLTLAGNPDELWISRHSFMRRDQRGASSLKPPTRYGGSTLSLYGRRDKPYSLWSENNSRSWRVRTYTNQHSYIYDHLSVSHKDAKSQLIRREPTQLRRASFLLTSVPSFCPATHCKLVGVHANSVNAVINRSNLAFFY